MLPLSTAWHCVVQLPSLAISLSFPRLGEVYVQSYFILRTNGVFGQKSMYLRKPQNSSVYNCYHLTDKGKIKSESAIFSLLSKEIINALQTKEDGKIEAIRKEIISGSKIV